MASPRSDGLVLPGRLSRHVSAILVGCQVVAVGAILVFELLGGHGSGQAEAWVAIMPAVGVSILVAAPFLALVTVAWGAQGRRFSLILYALLTVLLVVGGVVFAW